MSAINADKPITIGILDNDICALTMMDMLIRHGNPDIDVIWKETQSQRFFERFMFEHILPDIVIVDLALNGISGVDICRNIRKRSKTINIVAITSYPLEHYQSQVSQAGAQALVSKTIVGTPDFIQLLRALNQNLITDIPKRILYFNAPIETYHQMQQEASPSLLSQREINILRLYAIGKTTQEIAKQLGISIGTVQSHTSHAAHKLGVQHRFEAIRICQQQHLM